MIFVDETGELMVINEFGEIVPHSIPIPVGAAGRSTQGVKLLNLDPTTK